MCCSWYLLWELFLFLSSELICIDLVKTINQHEFKIKIAFTIRNDLNKWFYPIWRQHITSYSKILHKITVLLIEFQIYGYFTHSSLHIYRYKLTKKKKLFQYHIEYHTILYFFLLFEIEMKSTFMQTIFIISKNHWDNPLSILFTIQENRKNFTIAAHWNLK